MTSKRVKISFETVNKGNYTIIPAKVIAETNQRIKTYFKTLRKRGR